MTQLESFLAGGSLRWVVGRQTKPVLNQGFAIPG